MGFTTPPNATNGNPIASAHVNTLRDNSIWFNALLQHPTAAGQVPISTSTSGAGYDFIDSAQINDNALTTAKITDGTVGASQIADATLTTSELDSTVLAILVPTGLMGWVRQAAEIPSGWSRETDIDGRMTVGDGTTFSVTFTQQNNYGSSWAHTHPISGGMTAENTTATNVQATSPGVSAGHPLHSHTMSGTSTSAAWAIASRAYVPVRKD